VQEAGLEIAEGELTPPRGRPTDEEHAHAHGSHGEYWNQYRGPRGDGKEMFAICVDLQSGEIIHDIKVFDVPHPQLQYQEYKLNSHASPTPIVEQGCVYLHFGPYGTACLETRTGATLWQRRDLNCDHRVRAGSSPVIDGNSLVVTYDGVDVQFVAALDKSTGETLWLKKREVDSDFAATLRVGGIQDDRCGDEGILRSQTHLYCIAATHD